jgi:hypothetical protein
MKCSRSPESPVPGIKKLPKIRAGYTAGHYSLFWVTMTMILHNRFFTGNKGNPPALIWMRKEGVKFYIVVILLPGFQIAM